MRLWTWTSTACGRAAAARSRFGRVTFRCSARLLAAVCSMCSPIPTWSRCGVRSDLRPRAIGADYERALELLSRLNVRELCVFDHRERRLEPLGAAPPGHAVPPGQAASPGQAAPPGQAASRAAGGGNS